MGFQILIAIKPQIRKKEWVKNFGVAWPTLNTSENIEKPRTLFGLLRLKYKRDLG